MIKPKETVFNGYRMRSRLEARWAVFFTELGIQWEYEFEGFDLSDGKGYLPDFYLPTFSGGCWCEVKPDGGDFSRALLFAKDYEEKIWLCEGVPEKAIYKYVEPGDFPDVCVCGIPLWDQAYGENRFFVMPCCFYDACSGSPGVCHTERKIPIQTERDEEIFDNADVGYLVTNAIQKARSARFEYGENGLTHIGNIIDTLLPRVDHA